ncbi:MAG: hypothetical protein ABMA13_02555 [Chthoniobacteraceae bacterium]
MPRPSFTALIALSLLAAVSLTGCKTIYSDMYSSRRNYFKPEKDTPKPSDLLPMELPPDSAPAPALMPPGLDPAAPPMPAPDAAPGAPAPAPAIPGL